jgi:MoaA/NifB/PqqE/SkfB family radical SAM enzyme
MLQNYTTEIEGFKRLFEKNSNKEGVDFASFLKTLERLKVLWYNEKTWDEIFKEFTLEEIFQQTIKHTATYFKFDSHPITREVLAKRKYKCFAPFTTLNFDQNGDINVCCYNRSYVLATYPKGTVHEAWFGNKIVELRNDIQNLYFDKGCDLCVNQIVEDNYENSLIYKFNANYHDNMFEEKTYPDNFEFEISNICNYECIMCGGKWSSSIRKNREKLPPIISPYDDKFVDQLEEFFPHLKNIKFLGGEPFASPIYFKIMDRLSKFNTALNISITTNGSICNEKILNLKKTFPNLKIIVSLDSLDTNTYAMIRKNGNLDIVKKNIETFIANYMLDAIVFCPLIQNVRELPDIIRFVVEHRLFFGINTVTSALGGKIEGIHENGTEKIVYDGKENFGDPPVLLNKIPEFVLSTLNKSELKDIIKYLENERIGLYNKLDSKRHAQVISQFDGFIRYLHKLLGD